MSPFNSLTTALHLLGKVIDPPSITKVTMTFEHAPSDFGATDVDWKLKVSLIGIKEISEEGVNIAFTQDFTGVGSTEVEAFNQAFKHVQGTIQNFLRLRVEETKFAEQAMMTVSSPQNPDLASMWPSSDSHDEGQPGQQE